MISGPVTLTVNPESVEWSASFAPLSEPPTKQRFAMASACDFWAKQVKCMGFSEKLVHLRCAKMSSSVSLDLEPQKGKDQCDSGAANWKTALQIKSGI